MFNIRFTDEIECMRNDFLPIFSIAVIVIFSAVTFISLLLLYKYRKLYPIMERSPITTIYGIVGCFLPTIAIPMTIIYFNYF
jgi:hypothetical protein